MSVTLSAPQQTYTAAIVEAIKVYLDRNLFETSSPSGTVWDVWDSSLSPAEDGQARYSGQLTVPGIGIVSSNSFQGRQISINLQLTFRIALNDLNALELLAIDWCSQLNRLMLALNYNPLDQTGYDTSGTHRSFVFGPNTSFKVAGDESWRVGIEVNQGSGTGLDQGGVAMIQKTWIITDFI